MIDPTVLKRISGGEGVATGIVRGAFSMPAVAREVCGFLNSVTGGTAFVIPEPRLVADQKRGLLETFESQLKELITPSVLFSVDLEEADDMQVFVVNVPPGSDRPYVAEGAIWVRQGTETLRAKADDIRGMFSADPLPERWERRISPALEEVDIDYELVHAVLSQANETGRFHSSDMGSPNAFLSQVGLWRASGYTNAADILFARFPQQRHPQVRVQLVEYRRDKTDDSYEHYEWFEGSVLEIAERVFKVLSGYIRRRAEFSEGSIKRDERQNYEGFALREGIVNALAHRDYASYSGGVKVSVFPDRIEFWNSGRLPREIKAADLPRGHQSYPVNPDIAHLFYLNDMMDRTGRGAERIADSAKRLGAPPPKWRDDEGGVTLTVFAALGREDARNQQLNVRQKAYLDAVAPGEVMTLAEYGARFAEGLNPRQASRDLSELVSYRFVRKEGSARATVYRRVS
ncbi:ATP-binding protein [Asticcacaulis taihuensis]|uniref:ATP-dependent DNA helicase RecG n=1 Tax=Asticcacaulis taihuensis TaxID=260084 RepID=A0A1G4S9S0_9CAUL|nr:ATP-binding protein [Asticcacaulis taihuensis]SCW65741.1 ATP-dependent DNA helicase RecG [Asticcacaulis taihuensis]